MPVEVEIASEYRYRNPVIGPNDLVIGVSQSGETADTLAALRTAKRLGASTLAVCNVMGAQMTRDADGVLYTRAGTEVSVPATKTFVAQVAAFYLLALRLAELRGIALRRGGELESLITRRQAPPAPDHRGLWRRAPRISSGSRPRVSAGAQLLHVPRTQRRSADRPRRSALKLKEISYVATDAYAAGEMKHGPIALLDKTTPVDRGGHRVPGAGEADLEHPGGPRARRARDRDRDRGQYRDRRALRRGHPRARHQLDAEPPAGGHPAAAAGVLHCDSNAVSTSISRATSPRPSRSNDARQVAWTCPAG